jgi:hypothetical protein
MKAYKVKYKAVFEGEIIVYAEDKTRAKTIVHAGFPTPTLDVYTTTTWNSDSSTEEGINNWDFDTHAKKVIIT